MNKIPLTVFVAFFVLFMTSCSVLNPIQQSQSHENYLTVQDTYDATTELSNIDHGINIMDSEIGTYDEIFGSNIGKTDQNSLDAIINGHNRMKIAVDQTIISMRESTDRINDKLESITDRNQPKYSVKWYWWVIIAFIALFAIGGLPLVMVAMKTIKSISQHLGGLAEATYETMKADPNIDNDVIPETIKNKNRLK